MQLIFSFLLKYKYVLLFFFLELIALGLTIQNNSYHQSKFSNASNTITGGLMQRVNNFDELFNIRLENKKLMEENIRLQEIISGKFVDSVKTVETIIENKAYTYTIAKIIKNNYLLQNNFITINRGRKHGVSPNMGVINSNGLIGIVSNVGYEYATVLSILHKKSSINIRCKNTNHIGSLVWDGKDYNSLQLIDIPRQANLTVGDTIVSGGQSSIFPKGILVGTIKNFIYENNQYKKINVKPFNDMSNISNVYLISNSKKIAIDSLLNNPN